MTKQEHIRSFAAAGYALTPLEGKRPTETNWEATPCGKHDEKTIGAYNYGVVLGPRDLVVDVDPRNYHPQDDKPLERLFQGIGIPSTYIVRTGGGGLHIYFKKPSTVSVCNALPQYRGVEFKGGPGRQVVGPGSTHPETKVEYTVICGSPDKVAEAPAALLEIIKRGAAHQLKNEKSTGAAQEKPKDDEATKARYRTYLRDAAPSAIEGSRGDETTYKVACVGRDFGLSAAVVANFMEIYWNGRCQPPWDPEELKTKVGHAYAYARGALGSAHPSTVFEKVVADENDEGAPPNLRWKLDSKKQPVKCFQNLLNYFELPTVQLKGAFGYNEFTRRVEFLKSTPWRKLKTPKASPPMTDRDLQLLRTHLAKNHGYDASKDDLVDALVAVANDYEFHPVRDYLNGLKWDGVSRLDEWLIRYVGAPTDEIFVRAAGRKTLVAAVARIFEPGIKFDHVLVLEGEQGIGKSGVCRILAGEWFGDFKMSVEDKDTIQMMQGKWIVEMADLHVTRQADLDMVKSFLTRQVDEARFAYGRLPGQYPRQGIFIATYNPGPDGTYLKDETGNRRWWPVRCNGPFNFEGLAAVRDQLFAEAVALYKKGEELTMETTELKEAATAAQSERRAEHPWVERVAEWLQIQDKNEETRQDFYTGRQIFIAAMGGADTRYGRREALDVARVMKDLGWTNGFKRTGGQGLRGYWRSTALLNGNTNGGNCTPWRTIPGDFARAAAVDEKESVAIFGDLV